MMDNHLSFDDCLAADDVRHHECNVCKSQFTCEPPTRHELMASFTGPELASYIEAGCVIGAHAAFSRQLQSQLEDIPEFMHERTGYPHWINGSYLITKVEPDTGNVDIPVDSRILPALRSRLQQNDLTLDMRGKRLQLTNGGSLAAVPSGNRAALEAALASLEAPATLAFSTGEQPSCGDDHVVAVNLTRRVSEAALTAPQRAHVDGARQRAGRRLSRAAAAAGRSQRPTGESEGSEGGAGGACAALVRVEHYLGGPCEPERVVCCLVPGGRGRGWVRLLA